MTTIAQITSQLVSRGIPKIDPGPRDRWRWTAPPENLWMVFHPEPGLDGAPETLLSIDGVTADGHGWELLVISCQCCDAVVRTDLLLDGELIGELHFWPGLDGAIAMHRALADMFLDALEKMDI